jgi:ribosomal subunit interface protein
MKIPRINTKATNLKITSELQALLDQKLLPLEKFMSEAQDTKCDVELEKLPEHQSGKIYRAEINLFHDGKLYRAEAKEEQIEKAIDVARDDMKRELRRNSDKKQSLARKGKRAFKRMLRLGE